MPTSYTLTLKKGKGPHLYLDQLKELISHDDILMPQMKKMLSMMQKFNLPYILLPLQVNVIIDEENHCNYERAMQPTTAPWSWTRWNIADIEKHKKDKKVFIDDILILYDSMGFNYTTSAVSQDYCNGLFKQMTEEAESKNIVDKLK